MSLPLARMYIDFPPVNDLENKNGDAEPSFNISTQANLSDSWKPVRAALRYSYQSSHKNKNKSSLYYCVNLLAQYLQFYTNMYFRKFYQDITDINKDLS